MRTVAAFALFCVLSSPMQAAQNQPATASPTAAAPAAQANVQPKAIDPAKEADIRRLLDAMGTTTLIQGMMDRMVQSLKPIMANSLPPGDYRDQLLDLFFQKFRTKFATKQFIDLAVARYDENFSDAEIKGLIDFYQTPLGRKMTTVLPTLTAELQQDGQKYGQDIGRDSMVEVLQEHQELAQALQQAAARRAGGPNQ